MTSPDTNRSSTNRRGGRRPPLRAVAAAAAAALITAAAADTALAAEAAPIAPRQATVVLLAKHSVRNVPSFDARRVAYVGASRPITHARTVLPLLARETDSRGKLWLRVRLPGRALGQRRPPRVGWIGARNTRASSTPWHIVVQVATRSVSVYRSGRRLHRFRAIVGSRSTPTPRGSYFVEENVRLPAHHSGAPFALATSARSNVLQEFDGGPGQIALHGRGNIGGLLGTAVSHGCVRLADGTIAWLARRIAPGVPVTIR